VALCELAAGASVRPHLHPFEESWYVLDGAGHYAVAGLEYEVAQGDYGFAPIGYAHQVTAGERPLRWLAVRAPRPPAPRLAPRTVRAEPGKPVPLGRPSETDPRYRLAGHFDDGDLGAYGPLQMPGYHGPNIRSISLHMLVDRLLGAQHHTLFMVQFAPRAGRGQAAKEHYHPFEEIYFYLSGSARGTIDGQDVTIGAGDLLWMSVDGTHGFVNDNDEPVRFLEVQSPVPPDSDAFFFPGDWEGLPTP
jgi:quercetin dioxygenase-like cupin family protein